MLKLLQPGQSLLFNNGKESREVVDVECGISLSVIEKSKVVT